MREREGEIAVRNHHILGAVGRNHHTILLSKIVDTAREDVKTMVNEQNLYPEEYVKKFEEYMHLINGSSERETDEYVSQEHTFDEFKEKVIYFDSLGKTINNDISKVVELGMYELHCDDLILNLYRKTDGLRE